MKIVCDSCGAKYSIADEKVQGKVFKIRCKKCSNVIVVKGTAEAEAASGDDGLGAGAGAAEWYVVIDGEQVGPVTTVEIDSYFMSGKINTETYAWKDGMGDWMHIVEIPEFTHLGNDVAGPNEATTIADSAHRYDAGETDATNVVQSPLAMHDSGGDDYASDPGYGEDDYGYAAADDDEGYSGFAGSYDGGGGIAGLGGDLATAGGDDDAGAGMFAAFDTGSDSDFMSFGDEPAPATNGSNGSNGSHGAGAGAGAAGGGDLVGQRNENSVLFSLSSLDSVPAVGGDAKSDQPVTEGSGLIDIQALASAHKTMSGSGDAEGGGGIDPFAQGTMAMPALMPMGSHRSNNTLYIALAVGGIAVLGLLALGGYMIMRDDDKPQEQQVKVVERVIERVVEGEGPENADEIKKAADDAEKAAAETAPKKPENDEGDEAEDEKDDSKPAAAKKSSRRNNRKSAQKKSSASDEKKEEPKPKPKKGDGIDDLLSKIDDKAPAKKPSSSGSDKKSLSRNDVKQTINRYNSRINTCARSQNKSGKKGTVKVKFYIRPNGRVRGAQVVSSGFRGTDVGSCVQKVVGSMTFPKTAASKDVPVTYPFILK